MVWNNWLIFLFGAIVGSFLNVCIQRLPREESIALPGSHCRACNKAIPYYDLIPILSYVILLGKCRNCKKPFSIEYPIVELMTGLFAVVIFEAFGFRAQGFAYLLFVCSLIICTFVDLHHRIIPDVISIGGTIIGFLLSFHFLTIDYVNSLLGIAFGGGLLLLLATVHHKLTKREGMGGGDIKLAAMIGAFLGIKAVLLTLFISSVLGSLWGVLMIAIKKQNLQYALPFGPFLALAAIFCLFFEDRILFFLGY